MLLESNLLILMNYRHKKRRRWTSLIIEMAERVGFEPTKGYKPLPVFKTGAFSRSATSPDLREIIP